MSSFQETLQNLHALLRGGTKPRKALSYFGTTEKRLSIYPSFVKGHVVKFLDKNFLSLKTLFNEKTWNGILDEYFRKHAPTHWRLYRCAEAFPGYIQTLREKGLFEMGEFHTELADFEWAEAVVYHGEEIIPKASHLETLIVNPTLTILNFRYPIAQYVRISRSSDILHKEKAWLEHKKYLKPLEKEETVFLFRNPKTLVLNHCVPTDRMLLAIKMVHEKIRPKQAARTVGQELSIIHDALEEAQSQGLILFPEMN